MSKITHGQIRTAIYDKYIKPTKRPETKYVGVEFEFPIVNLEGGPVDFSLIHNLTDAFIKNFHFEPAAWDDDGYINSAKVPGNGDDLSFDCSYNTLEFSFGKEENLNEVNQRYHAYFQFVQDYLAPHNHCLTGMGINPGYQHNHKIPVPNPRYRMLLHHLSSYKKYNGRMQFHDIPYFGLLSCSSQTHIDVQEDQITETINTFNKLEPLKALLFSNSPMDVGNSFDGSSDGNLLCARDYLWRQSLHGLNPHNLDMYAKDLASTDEMVSYFMSMSLYCLERDGRYLNFEPTPLLDYFGRDIIHGEYYENGSYQQVDFQPRIEDIKNLRSFKFEDLTFRGTVELRSVCEQPASDAMSAPAFHAGLKAQLPRLTSLLNKETCLFQLGYTPTELRKMLVKRRLPSFIDKDSTAKLLVQILDIAKDGLTARGFGEEHLLDPLYQRTEGLMSPGREMAEGIESGKTKEYYIKKFGSLE